MLIVGKKEKHTAIRNCSLAIRYKQLRGVVEESVGEQRLPPDLPPDDQLIAEGAVTIGTGRSDTAEKSAIKGEGSSSGKLVDDRRRSG